MPMAVLSDETWKRHANPWSVWTRYAAFPILVAAVWSYHAVGWWALIPVAMTIGFLIVNPRLFPPPRSTMNWASKAVLGERVWLKEDRRFLPDQHASVFYALMIAAVVNLAALVWGIISADIVLTVVATLNVLIGKSWSNDRMVWLFSERSRTSDEYRKWLY
jgi:hypothetical protein